MKKIIITCRAHPGEPEWFALWQLARGTFEKYAAKHGYEYKDFWFDDFDEAEWPGMIHGRLPVWAFNPAMTQPCWLKIPAIHKCLQEYDVVLYLDNDCVILDHSKDILDDMPADKWLGMAEGTTGEGTGPNVGMVLTRSCDIAKKFWREAWDREEWRSAKWTDQGNVFACLGFNHNPPITKLRPTEYDSGYHILSSEWNDWTEGGVSHPWTRIYHAAWGRDGGWKLSVMRNALLQAEARNASTGT